MKRRNKDALSWSQRWSPHKHLDTQLSQVDSLLLTHAANTSRSLYLHQHGWDCVEMHKHRAWFVVSFLWKVVTCLFLDRENALQSVGDIPEFELRMV